MSVSLQDVADHCGVSRQTVGLILSQRPGLRYSAKTREKVMTSAKTLGYRQHGSAVAMRKQRFEAIAFLQDSNPFRSFASQRMLNAVEGRCRTLGLSTHFAQVDDLSEALPASIQCQTVDGYIVNYHGEIPAPVAQVVNDANTPVVWVNTKQSQQSVYVDEYESGALLARRVLDCGHRRIAYLHADINDPGRSVDAHYSVQDRLAGINDVMQDAGIAMEEWAVPVSKMTPKAACEYVAEALSANPDITAIISACHDGITQAALMAAMQQGRRVPDDLSVVSFSNDNNARHWPLSCMRTPWQALGEAAMTMLSSMIDEKRSDMASMVIPPQWVSGETLGSI